MGPTPLFCSLFFNLFLFIFQIKVIKKHLKKSKDILKNQFSCETPVEKVENVEKIIS